MTREGPSSGVLNTEDAGEEDIEEAGGRGTAPSAEGRDVVAPSDNTEGGGSDREFA